MTDRKKAPTRETYLQSIQRFTPSKPKAHARKSPTLAELRVLAAQSLGGNPKSILVSVYPTGFGDWIAYVSTHIGDGDELQLHGPTRAIALRKVEAALIAVAGVK